MGAADLLTLPNLLRNTVQSFGTRPAIFSETGKLSWAQYVDQVGRNASMLRSLGLEPGQRFGTLCRNSVRHAALLLGGYWSGTVPIPIDFRLTGTDIAWMLEDSGCSVLMLDEDLLYLLDQPQLNRWRGRAVSVGAGSAVPGLQATDLLLATATCASPHPVREDDIALHLYTGGTTGRGKGVRLTHRNIVANAMQLARVMAPSQDDIYLHVSPMFHSTDLNATVVSMFGGAHVYLKDASPEDVLESIEKHGVTIASLLPSMISRILRGVPVERYDLRSLRLISYGTSALDEASLRQAMKAFSHVGFHQCYGLTETSPYVAILDEKAHRRAVTDMPQLLKAAGRILPGTRLRLVDVQGHDMPTGKSGEIVISGPQVAAGYVGQPDAHGHGFCGHEFHTGDIGRIDEDGFLYIVDRKREVVTSGSGNVYTKDVEDVLHRCPGIVEAAVIGVQGPAAAETLLAVLVAADTEHPGPDAIIDFCLNYLEPALIPQLFMFVDRLPRTPLGKIRKLELQQAYLALGQDDPNAQRQGVLDC